MKKNIIVFWGSLFCILILSGCKNPSGNTNNKNTDQIFYVPSLNHQYSVFNTTHTVYEYHCKDLGDSYYEVEFYILHYFAASDGGDGSTHYNNGAYKNKTEGQLVDIIRNKTLTPDIIEKHMSASVSSKTITDYVTQKSVVIYISDKIKHEGYFYGITRK